MRDPAHPVRPEAGADAAPLARAQRRLDAQIDLWRDEPWRLDYFALMRRLESLAEPAPRWGRALLPRHELLRIGHEPHLSFAPASISQFRAQPGHGDRPLIRQQFFGYIGPNGPLPMHLSEFVRERALNRHDPTWLAFLDTFLHRFALYFYRAWAQPRPAVALDRPDDDRFRCWVGALIGTGTDARQQRDQVRDDARLHFSGWLVRRVHNAESVEAVIGGYFGVTAQLQRWVGHWMAIDDGERTRLQGSARRRPAAACLGCGAVLGSRVWDRQHRVRLRLGPLSLEQYRRFLPTGSAYAVLQRWMSQLLGDELEWDVQLVLARDEVPPSRLGAASGNGPRLGWVSWLGQRARDRDAGDVYLPPGLSARVEKPRSSFV